MSEVFVQAAPIHQQQQQQMVGGPQMAGQMRMMPQQQQAPPPETINKMLEDNTNLVTAIADHQTKGRMQDTLEMQKQLHRNLVYLASLAYPNKPSAEIQNLLPVIFCCCFFFNVQDSIKILKNIYSANRLDLFYRIKMYHEICLI